MPVDDDSDSNSLPDLNDLFPAPSDKIRKGDIVWAKFRKLYWPALVRHVYRKEKKVGIWYTDAPGKHFKILLRNVSPFHDPVISAKVKKEAKEKGVLEKVESLTSHALSYLNRKAKGNKDDPRKFFDLNYPFFTLEEWLKKNPNANPDDFSDLRVGSMIHAGSHKAKRKTSEIDTDTLPSDEDSEVISVESEDISDEDHFSDDDSITVEKKIIPQCSYPSIKKKKMLELSNSSESVYVNKILTCINEGKADKYLEAILLRNEFSQYVQFFERAVKGNKKDLTYISYGPVEDIITLREISFYLLDLYDNISHKIKLKKSDDGSFVPILCNNNFEKAHFVSSVWLPESIVYAISEIENVSISQAKDLFFKKPLIMRDKIENIVNSTDEEFSHKPYTDHSSEKIISPANKSFSQKPHHTEHLSKNIITPTDKGFSQKCHTECLKHLFFKKPLIMHDKIENVFNPTEEEFSHKPYTDHSSEKIISPADKNFSQKPHHTEHLSKNIITPTDKGFSQKSHTECLNGKDKKLYVKEIAVDKKSDWMNRIGDKEYTRQLMESFSKRKCVVLLRDISEELDEKRRCDSMTSSKTGIPKRASRKSKRRSITYKKRRKTR